MILTTQKLRWVRTPQRSPVVIALLLAGAAAAAPQVRADQRGHNLGNPAPRSKMRPLAADRPDATESPQTVDAGHVQLEIDIAAYLRDRSDTVADGWSFVVTNFKLGLSHNIDLQIVFATHERLKTPGGTASGFGDLVVRTKINLWGNDGDTPTMLAVMPFVKFPTNQDGLGNNEVEGGLIVPFGTELPAGWGLGLQLELDIVRNSSGTGNKLDISHTIVLGHDIVGPLAGFVELFSLFPGERGAGWIGTLNAGLTYAIDEDTQIDLGTFVGLSREADDLVVFLGITRRF